MVSGMYQGIIKGEEGGLAEREGVPSVQGEGSGSVGGERVEFAGLSGGSGDEGGHGNGRDFSRSPLSQLPRLVPLSHGKPKLFLHFSHRLLLAVN